MFSLVFILLLVLYLFFSLLLIFYLIFSLLLIFSLVFSLLLLFDLLLCTIYLISLPFRRHLLPDISDLPTPGHLLSTACWFLALCFERFPSACLCFLFSFELSLSLWFLLLSRSWLGLGSFVSGFHGDVYRLCNVQPGITLSTGMKAFSVA